MLNLANVSIIEVCLNALILRFTFWTLKMVDFNEVCLE